MQPMTTIRHWQIDQLRKFIPVLGQFIRGVSQEDATTFRDGGDGWTVVEVMCHLRDVEATFLERAKLTTTEDFPDLPFSDPTQRAIDEKYNETDLQTAYDTWVENRQAYIAFMEAVGDDEDQWERPGKHPNRGKFTLNDQLFLVVWHDMNHFEQVVRIIQERQS